MNVVVIGGGITGLAAARAHLDRGHRVTVVTDQTRLGGVLGTTVIDGMPRNHSAQSFALTEDLESLFATWDMSDAVRLAPPSARVRCIVYEGRVYRIASPLQLITTGLLPLSTVLNGLLRLRRSLPEGEPTIADVVRHYTNQLVVDRVARPIVSGIFAGDPERLSFKACFPKRRGRRTVVIPTLGMADLVERIASCISDVRYGHPVRAIERNGNSWVVRTDGEQIRADRVICTVGAHAAASLIKDMDCALSDGLARLPYGGVRIVHCSYEKTRQRIPLRAFGALWANEGPVRGMLNLSVLMDDDGPTQYSVIFVATTSSTQDAISEVRRVFKLDGVIRIDLEEDWTTAIPQYEPGHQALMAQVQHFEQQHPGLLLAGNYRGGVSVGDRIINGVATAWMI